MNNPEDKCLPDGVQVTPEVGLAWHVAVTDPAACYEHNLTTFLLLESLAEPRMEMSDKTADGLQSIQARLDLLIQLVSGLLVQQQPLPPRQSVRLAATGIEWHSPDPPPTQTWLEVFLEPHLPRAIWLPVENRQLEERAGSRLICSRFREPEPLLVEHLEKWIFRRHRREIAQQRQTLPDER